MCLAHVVQAIFALKPGIPSPSHTVANRHHIDGLAALHRAKTVATPVGSSDPFKTQLTAMTHKTKKRQNSLRRSNCRCLTHNRVPETPASAFDDKRPLVKRQPITKVSNSVDQ
jgi:hypothetical protein